MITGVFSLYITAFSKQKASPMREVSYNSSNENIAFHYGEPDDDEEDEEEEEEEESEVVWSDDKTKGISVTPHLIVLVSCGCLIIGLLSCILCSRPEYDADCMN